MKLYLSTTSPYSRLALIAALHSGKRDLQLHYVLKTRPSSSPSTPTAKSRRSSATTATSSAKPSSS